MRQLIFAPPDRRAQQTQRTETLHDEVNPKLNYPLDYIRYRITGYRSESISPMLLTGQAILPDLRLIIDQLSYSVPIPVTEDRPVVSPQQLAEKLGVSTKTITRWRALGLRWRWVIQSDQKQKTVAYATRAVELFLDQHSQIVDRANRHSFIDTQTRQRVIIRARRIAEATDASMNRAAAHLAKKIGRAHQSVRLILEQHDQDHPLDKIFVDRTAPLGNQQKRIIAHAYRRGTPISELSRRMRRTRSTIYRAVRHQRAAVLCRLPLSYTLSPEFDQKDADKTLLKMIENPPLTSANDAPDPSLPLKDLPASLHGVFNHPRHPPGIPQKLLTQLNYSKHKASQLRDQLDQYDPRAADLDQIESYIRHAATVRHRLVVESLPVVLSVAQRHLIDQTDHSTVQLIELLETGIGQLIYAVDHYDVSREQLFDSYLTWLLMRSFLAHQPSEPSGLTRAHRRIDADTAVQRLRLAAARGWIRLTIPPA